MLSVKDLLHTLPLLIQFLKSLFKLFALHSKALFGIILAAASSEVLTQNF